MSESQIHQARLDETMLDEMMTRAFHLGKAAWSSRECCPYLNSALLRRCWETGRAEARWEAMTPEQRHQQAVQDINQVFAAGSD